MNDTIEQFDEMKIALNDSFKFHCTQCGNCCIHRDDILLNPKDLFKISQKLKIKPNGVLDKYCEAYIGSESSLPVVRLQPQGPLKRCPLLNGRKCSVHDSKPLVCAMFPIGRGIKLDKNQKSVTASGSKIEYIFVDPKCGDDSETHIVREWLNDFNIPTDDPFFFEWTSVLIELSTFFKELKEHLPEKQMRQLWSASLISLYLKYDTEESFLPQFKANTAALLELIRTLSFDTITNNQ